MTIHNGMPASEPDEIEWRKSRRSGPQGGNCVEVALLPDGQVAIRNSRHAAGPALLFRPSEWEAFLGGAKNGEFDLRGREIQLRKMPPMRGPRAYERTGGHGLPATKDRSG